MPASPLAAILERDGIVILDGGLGTELERRGRDLRNPLWSARLLADDPEAIVDAHLAYYRAGAQIATSASYQASFEGFARRGIDRDQAAGLMRRSVELAAEARRRFRLETHDDPVLLVAASVGPYGAMLADGSEYRGDYGLTVAQLRDFHGPRLEVLAAAGADLMALETVPSVAEGEALVGLLGDLPETPAWLSFSCSDGAHTRHGEPIEAAVALAGEAPGIVAIGINCTEPGFVEELIGRARSATAKPVVVYPNGGKRWNATGRSWSGEPAPGFAGRVGTWFGAGARIVGGCCRVGPEMIQELATQARAIRAAAPPPPPDVLADTPADVPGPHPV